MRLDISWRCHLQLRSHVVTWHFQGTPLRDQSLRLGNKCAARQSKLERLRELGAGNFRRLSEDSQDVVWSGAALEFHILAKTSRLTAMWTQSSSRARKSVS